MRKLKTEDGKMRVTHYLWEKASFVFGQDQ